MDWAFVLGPGGLLFFPRRVKTKDLKLAQASLRDAATIVTCSSKQNFIRRVADTHIRNFRQTKGGLQTTFFSFTCVVLNLFLKH